MAIASCPAEDDLAIILIMNEAADFSVKKVVK